MSLLGRHKRVLLRLAAWSLLESAQTFLLGFALARALDDGFLAGRAATGVGWLAAAAVAVLAGALGTRRVYGAVAAFVEPVRDDLVRAVVARGLREADDAALSRLTQQVELARDTLAGLVLVARTFVFTAAGALIGLFALAPALLAVVGGPLVVGLLLFAVTLGPLARRQEEFLAADERLAAELGLIAGGLRDIAASGAQERAAAGAGARIDDEYRAARSLAYWGTARTFAVGIGGRLPLVLLLATPPWLLRHGVTAGGLAGALAYLTQSLLPALQALVQGLGTSGARLSVVLRRLTPGQERRPADPPSPDGAWPVRLNGLVFAYGPGAAPVIDRLGLAVPAGERLAVAGPSGIGKSTLLALIAGVLRPDAGTVALGCERVLVPQEAYVFTATLRENLGYFSPQLPCDEALVASARAVGAGSLLTRIGGLDAMVDPAALSNAERQLLALARAHVSPAPLVLLDEATCHLDPAAEARAERAFTGRTLVIVAHRTGSARRADRVLLMDGARAELGTHEELLARSVFYRDLTGNGPSHPPLPLGDSDRVDPVARPRLAGDGGHVIAYGAVGKMEPQGDVGDRGALRGE